MVEEPKSIFELHGIDLASLTGGDKMNLIGEIYEELTAQQLRQMRDLADAKQREKLDDAKQQIIAEMREKFVQLDVDFDEVMGSNRRWRKSPLLPKYKSPDGKTWSGRGYPPQWIRDLDDTGGDREIYLIKDER